MAKLALLIGVSTYPPGLEPLPSAINDVVAMQAVLTNPDIGGFATAEVVQNPTRQAMETAIYRLFAHCSKDDLVLLYFSGHGVVDSSYDFYLSACDTQKDQGKLVPPTAVAAKSIQAWMEQSRASRQVIILDSCFSGAFAQGVKAKDGGSINLEQFLGGKGRAILTASTSDQYALTQEGFDLSVYTHYLVEGLRTGGADQDDDGSISAEELHAYASSKVQESAPAMTPEFYPVRDGSKILLAKSPKDDPTLNYRKQVEQRAHQGRFSIPARRLLNSLRLQLQLTPEVAEAIEAEVLQPYRDYQRKLQEYEQTLVEALQAEIPLSRLTLRDLKDYQQHLALLDADVEPIQTTHLGPPQAHQVISSPPSPSPQSSPSPPPSQTSALSTVSFEVVTVNDQGSITQRQQREAQQFLEDLGNGITLDMVQIPGGSFQMGTADSEKATIIEERLKNGTSQENAETWTNWETPQHQVIIPDFFMGKTPITQAQYQAIMGKNPSKFKGANRPVELVSWQDASEFCQRLSTKTGKDYRLPSEAEWEYACRAGTTTPFYFGATITPDLVNYNGDHPYGNAAKGKYREQTTEVGSFPPNAFGLYDLHGTVWEWCADNWHNNYNQAPTDGSIWKTSNFNNDPHVLRGGSWIGSAMVCRAAFRDWYDPVDRSSDLGFRVVCVPGVRT